MEIGKLIIITGVVLVVIGLLMQFTSLFRLPGDILIKRDNFTFSFPIVSSIIISIILTILASLLFKK